MQMPTLDSLLQRCASGDQTAFSSLYDELIGSVFGLAKRVLRDPAQAEEVAHDVMLEVWQKSHQFDADRGSAKGWIATITRRRAIDAVRSEQSRRNRDGRQGVNDVVPGSGDPVGDVVSDREDRDRVRTALDHLTDLQRQAIDLAYFGGLTYREVAERLDVPLGTIKTRMRDGLKRLSTVMDHL